MPFPTPPGPRVAYDLDGTVGLIVDKSTQQMMDLAPEALAALNSQNRSLVPYVRTSGGSRDLWVRELIGDTINLTLVFPEPLRLYGLLRAHSYYFSSSATTAVFLPGIETSTNSTNGVDGDWLPLLSAGSSFLISGQGFGASGVNPSGEFLGTGVTLQEFYRNPIASNALGWEALGGGAVTRHVKALRISRRYVYSGLSYGWQSVNLHLYGEPDTSASSTRLAFWRPSTDLPLAAEDMSWGDVPLGSSADKTFRIKNMSTTATATDVLVDIVPGLPAGTPSVDQFVQFSADGGTTWTPTLTISSLSPGAISPVLRARRVVPSDAPLGSFSPRIVAEVGEWI